MSEYNHRQQQSSSPSSSPHSTPTSSLVSRPRAPTGVSQNVNLRPGGTNGLTRMRSRSLLYQNGDSYSTTSLHDEIRDSSSESGSVYPTGGYSASVESFQHNQPSRSYINKTSFDTVDEVPDHATTEDDIGSGMATIPESTAPVSATPSLHFSDGSSSSAYTDESSPPQTPVLMQAATTMLSTFANNIFKHAASKLGTSELYDDSPDRAKREGHEYVHATSSSLGTIGQEHNLHAPTASTSSALFASPPRRTGLGARARSYLTVSIPPTPVQERESFDFAPPTRPGQSIIVGSDENKNIVPSSLYERPEYNTSTSSRLIQNAYDHGNGIAARPLAVQADSFNGTRARAATLSSARQQTHTLANLLPPIIFLAAAFCTCLVLIYFAISTIPLKLPHNVSEIKEQASALRDYSRKGFTEGLHVTAVLSALFVFKQAFSVPGSILVNILFGSLYGTYAATAYACIFTGVGSVLAYYMARLCAPLVERYLPRALNATRSKLLSGTSADLFSYLLLARLFPLLPYSVLNIACGVLHVPVVPYFATLVLGSFPYNFVTTQLGDLLGELATSAGEGNVSSIWTWDLCVKLAIASVLSAAPLLFKQQLRTFLGGSRDQPGSPGKVRLTDRRKVSLSPAVGVALGSSFRSSEDVISELHPAIPLLRRERTDSTASEVLAAHAVPVRSSLGHSHKRSLSIKLRDSWDALCTSCSTAAQAASSSLSASSTPSYARSNSSRRQPYKHVASASFSLQSDSINNPHRRPSSDEESGDTDEEAARERRASREGLTRVSSSSSFDSWHRRTASVSMTEPDGASKALPVG